MRRATLLVGATALLMAGCATIKPRQQPDGDQRFKNGLAALTAGNFPGARSEFSWLSEHNADELVGQRALLILAALEMDPRNPERHSDVGSDLAAGFLQKGTRDTWVDPVAQTLYLLGLELGAEERAAQQPQARPLPKLTGPTVTARIRTVEQERDRLTKRISALEEQLAQKDRELERIRKTIKQ